MHRDFFLNQQRKTQVRFNQLEFCDTIHCGEVHTGVQNMVLFYDGFARTMNFNEGTVYAMASIKNFRLIFFTNGRFLLMR